MRWIIKVSPRHDERTPTEDIWPFSLETIPQSVKSTSLILRGLLPRTYIPQDALSAIESVARMSQPAVILETAFDEAWITLKTNGSSGNIRPDELARRICHLAMEGERDPVRLHDRALLGLIPATIWRELS